jgi:hypothetical protein
MNETAANPIFVAFLFILRCLVPLVILFGISYLLRRLGLVTIESPEAPDEENDSDEETDQKQKEA